jgi:hypothetical protein
VGDDLIHIAMGNVIYVAEFRVLKSFACQYVQVASRDDQNPANAIAVGIDVEGEIGFDFRHGRVRSATNQYDYDHGR